MENSPKTEPNSLSKTNSCEEPPAHLFRQAGFYFFFAVLMILLNIILQNLHSKYFLPWVADNFGNLSIIQQFYLSTEPYNMPELIGSGIAVVITYITKFILDKFIVFQKGKTGMKATRQEFMIYFVFAILTTIENIGIQFILGILTPWALNIRIIIALTCGYITKFILDRKYCFKIS